MKLLDKNKHIENTHASHIQEVVNNFTGCGKRKSSGKPIRNLTTTWIRYINIEKSVVSRMFTGWLLHILASLSAFSCLSASYLWLLDFFSSHRSLFFHIISFFCSSSSSLFDFVFFVDFREKLLRFFPVVVVVRILSVFLFLMFSFIIIFLLFNLFFVSSCLSFEISTLNVREI